MSPRSNRFLFLRDSLGFAVASLRAHKTRTMLTALSMTVANAAVIIVVTVALTGRDFVIRQIEGVGSNLIYAYYEPGGSVSLAEADYITTADMEAVRRGLGAMARGVAGVMSTWDRIFIEGRAQQVRVLGSNLDYRVVRNLEIPAGRFFDSGELSERRKVCLLTVRLAEKLFGGAEQAIGREVKVHGLDFSVIGVFTERVETFGQSEVAADSILIPLTVMQYFRSFERIDPLYVSVRSAEEVGEAVGRIREILTSRGRPGSVYRVESLTGVLEAAQNIAAALTVVLVLIAAVTLGISGVFIMNIMLIAVTERTREIGIRMSVGATRKQIQTQFLLEAVMISSSGGLAGVALGVLAPAAAQRLLPGLNVIVSPWSVAAAVLVSGLVGAVFGLLPASRAAQLNPVEALRYE